MIDPASTGEGTDDPRPLVISLCGTYLKAEMQSLHRQIANLERFRTVVLAEKVENFDQFPFETVIRMEKRTRPRYRGNFLLRFWYKHIIRQWPPPQPIGHVGRSGEYYHPYDLVDRLDELKPALIHVYYGHKAVKYLRMLEAAGVPWIVSFHGVDVVKFIRDPEYLRRLKRVFAEAELVLARSESLLKRLAGLGCPPEKLRLNRTPVPLDRIPFHPRSAPANGEWRLLQACRLIPKKGLFTTLKALPAVLEKWPQTKFVLCGRGPDEEKFRRAVEEAGLQENVEMLGWLSQEQLLQELEKAHIFLHPSELTKSNDQEGVPNSMLEGMAAGLPVVATRHGGIPEAVDDGSDGYLAPEKDPEALSAALLKLMGDPGTYAAFSAQAHRTVNARFGFREQIAALEDCYAEAIAQRPALDSQKREENAG